MSGVATQSAPLGAGGQAKKISLLRSASVCPFCLDPSIMPPLRLGGSSPGSGAPPAGGGGLYGGATSSWPPPLVASFLLFLPFSKQFTTSSPSPLHLLHASSDPNPVANLSSVAFFPLLPVVPRLLLALYTSIGLQLPLNFLPNQNPN